MAVRRGGQEGFSSMVEKKAAGDSSKVVNPRLSNLGQPGAEPLNWPFNIG